MTLWDHSHPTYLGLLGSFPSPPHLVQSDKIKSHFHTRTEVDVWIGISTFDRCGYSNQSFLHRFHGRFSHHLNFSANITPIVKSCPNSLHSTPAVVVTLEEHIVFLTLYGNFLFACLLDNYSPLKACLQLENKEEKKEKGWEGRGKGEKVLFFHINITFILFNSIHFKILYPSVS